MDDRNNVANYKYTHFVEIVPLCKDDLLYLPSALAKSLGNISRLVLVKNISEVIHVIDPFTCQTAQFSADVYWRHESSGDLRPIITASRSRFTPFIVLGKDAMLNEIADPIFVTGKKRREVRKNHRKNKLALLTVSREVDLGVNDQQFETVSHMGYLMKSGDKAIGYDLTNIQFVNDEAEEARSSGLLPSIVILRKLYSVAVQPDCTSLEGETRTVSKPDRMFRLQKLDVDVMDGEVSGSRKKNVAMEVDDEDEEEFLRQVEADREMRANINMYKSDVARDKSKSSTVESLGEEEDDEDDQQIRLEELLDGLVLDELDHDPSSNQILNDDMSMGDIVNRDEMNDESGNHGKGSTRDVLLVGREDARKIQDKDMAYAVSEFGKEYK
jgi:nonsense-mediated mRNA decay protein 3